MISRSQTAPFAAGAKKIFHHVFLKIVNFQMGPKISILLFPATGEKFVGAYPIRTGRVIPTS